jgi:hypothetical protein
MFCDRNFWAKLYLNILSFFTVFLHNGKNYNRASIGYLFHLLKNTLRIDRLCGLVVRVPGYRSKDPEFDSRPYQIVWEVVGLKRSPRSLVRITEELREWKNSGFGSRKSTLTAMGIRCADHATHSIRKSWH